MFLEFDEFVKEIIITIPPDGTTVVQMGKYVCIEIKFAGGQVQIGFLFFQEDIIDNCTF